jgi:L-alanine-DL-glutamate epimerase-like enolase superfamily enzyme
VQIKSIEPIAVSLPMRKPVIMAGEEVRRADNVLVRIESDDGVVGWGEAASAPVMTGDTLESIVSAVHYMSSALRGHDPADIAGALAAMDGRMYGNHGAKAAIEIALHDLAGRASAKPVHAMLGGKKRSRIPLLGVIGGGDLAGDLRDAASKKGDGVTAYKIKVGIDTPDLQGARQWHAHLRRRQPRL